MTATHDQIPETALDWLDAGRRIALATVVETWGSAPRPAGAQLVIAEDGQFEGSVSGGCVEGAVILEALEAMADGAPRLLDYGVSDGDAFGVGLACGGNIRILVEPVATAKGPGRGEIAALAAARAARRMVGVAVNLVTAERMLIGDAGTDDTPTFAGARMQSGKAGIEGDWLIVPHAPALRLIVVGAAHIAQSLVPMARMLGYAVILADPRDAFASPERFPGTLIRNDYADAVLAEFPADASTAIVTLAHDPKIDDPALIGGLSSPAFYVGALGSRRTHAKRVERLLAAGLDATTIARIDAPVGLPIGAATPPEIAVSILGGMTARLRGGG